MSRSSLLVLAVVMGGMLALPAQAQWKWRDGTGRVQYSDLPPPPSVAAKDILQQPPSSRRGAPGAAPAPEGSASSPLPTPPASSQPRGEPELEAKRKAAEQEKLAKAKADEENVARQRADNCVRAKGTVKALEDGVRMSRTSPNGEREVLDDAARAQELARTRAIVASDCK